MSRKHGVLKYGFKKVWTQYMTCFVKYNAVYTV